MIGQAHKPLGEIIEVLEGERNPVLYGRSGCTEVFHTSSEPDVERKGMSEILFKNKRGCCTRPRVSRKSSWTRTCGRVTR